ncbi:MAG: SH3 domain-containing protein [Chloroflexi bacterium]|nr:SH3 domain-containing protein [Chloroflexota bacterium]
MQRQRMVWMWAGLLAVVSLACNAFAGPSQLPLLPPPGQTAVNTAVPSTPSGNLAPTVTLPGQSVTGTAVAPTPNDGQPAVRMVVDLNIRSGPGVQYARVGFFLAGDRASVTGRHAASGWWRVQCPPLADGPDCWVSGGSAYTTAVNTAAVPDIAAPPPPNPPPTATPRPAP